MPGVELSLFGVTLSSFSPPCIGVRVKVNIRHEPKPWDLEETIKELEPGSHHGKKQDDLLDRPERRAATRSARQKEKEESPTDGGDFNLYILMLNVECFWLSYSYFFSICISYRQLIFTPISFWTELALMVANGDGKKQFCPYVEEMLHWKVFNVHVLMKTDVNPCILGSF